jgi:DNA-binding NarL/FixJ family response regulator
MILAALKPLSQKERQIAILVAEGWTMRQIAEAIGWRNKQSTASALKRISAKLPGRGTHREIITRWVEGGGT